MDKFTTISFQDIQVPFCSGNHVPFNIIGIDWIDTILHLNEFDILHQTSSQTSIASIDTEEQDLTTTNLPFDNNPLKRKIGDINKESPQKSPLERTEKYLMPSIRIEKEIMDPPADESPKF